jgi:hypothetical protein
VHDTADDAARAVMALERRNWEKEKDYSLNYAARKLEEVEQHNVAAARREEDERRRRLQTEHAHSCRQLVQRVRDAPDGAAGEAIVEELQQAMDLRSDQVWEGGSRRYLWAGDERKEAVLMLRERRQREGKARGRARTLRLNTGDYGDVSRGEPGPEGVLAVLLLAALHDHVVHL